MSNRNQRLLLYVSGVLTMLTSQSCTHYYYGPNSANVPLLEKKGDARIAAGIAGADETTGFEMQTSYAFSNHFGGMINLYKTGGKSERSNPGVWGPGEKWEEKGGGTYCELGAGYFNPLEQRGFIVETYAGIGLGNVSNTYYMSEASKIHLTKFFLQPSLGYTNLQSTLQIAFSSRFSLVNFKVEESNVTLLNNETAFREMSHVKTANDVIFWEPSLVLRGGFKNMKLQLQLTSSKAFKKDNFSTQEAVFALSTFFSLGVKKAK